MGMVQIFVTSQLIVSAVHNSRAYKSVSCFASVSSLIVQLFFFAGGSGSRISGNLTRILLVPLYSIFRGVAFPFYEHSLHESERSTIRKFIAVSSCFASESSLTVHFFLLLVCQSK